ncbi:MAG: hypothetical protein KDN19_19535 [Verrucomicrobiae bacterium]|nr:hypothetical protein [Verrucomicrobiae bacterium]
MIALPAELPFIRISQENLALCEPAWLQQTLKNAANAAEVPEWLAEDVSKGVECYLKNHYPGTVIEVGDLFDRIRSTLHNLGLNDLADHLDDCPPPIRISLTELARKAGPGFELGFFQLLQRQFHAAADGGARQLVCYGLRTCVKRLATAEKWSPRCRKLEAEIRDFLQQQHRTLCDDIPDLRLAIN